MGELREGTTTLLFTDVEGSTDLGTRSGDDAARRVLRHLEEIIRAQIARHEGLEVKSLGDGLMVAFHSARRAVACAADIQRGLASERDTSPEDLPPVRIGLNAGEVFHEEGGVLRGGAAAHRQPGRSRAGERGAGRVRHAGLGGAPRSGRGPAGGARAGFARPVTC